MKSSPENTGEVSEALCNQLDNILFSHLLIHVVMTHTLIMSRSYFRTQFEVVRTMFSTKLFLLCCELKLYYHNHLMAFNVNKELSRCKLFVALFKDFNQCLKEELDQS